MTPRALRLSTSLRSTNLLRASIPRRSISIAAIQQTPKLKLASSFTNTIPTQNSIRSSLRPFSTTKATSSPAPSSTSGKSQADLIVEELQELYETATDELEIATESTDSATIYAASDRESARDALNSLVIAYELYVSPDPGTAEKEIANVLKEQKAQKAQAKRDQGEEVESEGKEGEGEEGEERIVELEFDPAEVSAEAKEEVKKRVGQRVREVKSAVEGLERRAHD